MVCLGISQLQRCKGYFRLITTTSSSDFSSIVRNKTPSNSIYSSWLQEDSQLQQDCQVSNLNNFLNAISIFTYLKTEAAQKRSTEIVLNVLTLNTAMPFPA